VARKTAKRASADPAELESLARAALGEIAPAEQVGPLLETRPGAEEGLTDLVFEPLQRGYQGWSWVVTLAAVTDAVTGEAAPPTVVEFALLPGEGALLAPEWVPWSVRLAEWEAQQKALAEAGESSEGVDDSDEEEPGDDSDDEVDDLDVDDLDDADLDDEFDEDDDDEDEDPDADDEDDADLDEDGPTRTHGGDIDGVDIDDLDDSDD